MHIEWDSSQLHCLRMAEDATPGGSSPAQMSREPDYVENLQPNMEDPIQTQDEINRGDDSQSGQRPRYGSCLPEGVTEDDEMAMSVASSDDELFVPQTEHREDAADTDDTRDERNAEGYTDDDSHQPDDTTCAIINARNVPDDTMTKFTAHEFGWHLKYPNQAAGGVPTSRIRVKMEEGDEDGIALSDFSDGASDDDGDSDPDFQAEDVDDLSDGERPAKRRRRSSKRRKNQSEERVQTDHENAGNGDGPENPQDQSSIDDELVELLTQEEELNALKAKGLLTPQQRIALARIRAKIKAIEKSMAAEEPGGPGDAAHGEDEDQTADRAISQVIAHLGLEQAPTPTSPAPANDGGETAENGPGHASSGTGQKTRRRPARSAKEYWERQYAEHGSGSPNLADNTNKRKRPLNQRTKAKISKKARERESRLAQMLKDADPIMARAAQGAMAMPGPIQAKTHQDQLKAYKAFLFKISGNPTGRHHSVDVRILKEAAKSFGFRQLQARDGMWKLKGMKSMLYNHQLVGVRWMLGQEFSPDGPYGGILGDQMGLGKTVQALAAMCANQPSREDVNAGRHQTLIVAPASAVSQWIREIDKHCEESFVKCVHHYRAHQNIPRKMWKQATVM